MSVKPNYFKIGVFLIVAIILILVAIVFFGAGLFNEEKIYFETYFDGSVSGLDIGAPVEFRGVRMGQVKKITFALSEYDMEVGSEDYFTYGNYVMVLVSLDVDILPVELVQQPSQVNLEQFVERGFRIRLASNILTGQAYLQGDYLDPERYPVIAVPWEPRNPYISSAPSDFTTMKESVDRIVTQLEKVDTERIGRLIEQILVSINQAIDDANIPEISGELERLVADIDQVVNDVDVADISSLIQNFVTSTSKVVEDVNAPALSREAQNLFAELRQTNQHLMELLKTPENTDSQMANIAVMISNLNILLTRIDRLVLTQSPQVERALENLAEASSDLEELINQLRQNPSQLMNSQPPSKSEVSQ